MAYLLVSRQQVNYLFNWASYPSRTFVKLTFSRDTVFIPFSGIHHSYQVDICFLAGHILST